MQQISIRIEENLGSDIGKALEFRFEVENRFRPLEMRFSFSFPKLRESLVSKHDCFPAFLLFCFSAFPPLLSAALDISTAASPNLLKTRRVNSKIQQGKV